MNVCPAAPVKATDSTVTVPEASVARVLPPVSTVYFAVPLKLISPILAMDAVIVPVEEPFPSTSFMLPSAAIEISVPESTMIIVSVSPFAFGLLATVPP